MLFTYMEVRTIEMGFSIAIAGKGGTGKTTLAGLLVKCLKDRHLGPILAIDADPNSNLNYVLGMEVTDTVGDIREDVTLRREDLPSGMSKPDYINFKIYSSVMESEGYDLIVMGRPEGRGCYCFANDVLRRAIDTLSGNYPYIVMDEEAGMEHLSRRTTRDLDVLVMCADPSLRSLIAVSRIQDMADELELNVSRKYLVVCRLTGELPESMSREIERLGLDLAGIVPYDDVISEYELAGRSLLELPNESAAMKAVCELAGKLEIPQFATAKV
jgi:CO dehydrogenase maturation factor